MKRFATFALTAATLLLTQGCKKDAANPQPTTPTTEQLLSANVWRMTALTANPGLITTTGTTVTNLYPFIPSCTKDDTQQFVAGGVFKADEGATKCDVSDPQTTTGTWVVSKAGADTNVAVTVSGSVLHFKVLSVNDKELTMSSTDDVFGLGVSTTLTLTYTKL